MKLRKTISRILALGTGATMVGATLLSATAAADLATYPDPFVQDGKFNAIIVVGDSAAASDVIGSVDVATSLQFASRVQKTVSSKGGSSVSVSGDAWQAGTSTKQFELSENLDSGTKIETLRSITTFIDSDDLDALADGVFSNEKGTANYNQYVYFDDGLTGYVYYVEDDDDVTADFLYFPSGKSIARYELEFTTSAESDVTDTSGDALATGTRLWSLEDEELVILGKTYSIVKAERAGGTNIWESAKLTLMGGAIRDVIDEGDTKTYTVNDKDYDVTLDFVGTTSAKFIVNGEITDSIREGGTDKLADGTEVGVQDILAQEFAGGVRKVEFYFGAQKIVVWDTDITDSASSKDLEVSEETIDDAHVIIEGTDDNTTFKLDSIQINITADDDYYVPVGGVLTALMDEPQAFLDSWDISYEGLTKASTEKIRIKTSGSDEYQLVFTDWNDNEVSVPLVYTSGSTALKHGDKDDDLVLNESQAISKNDYFFVSDSTQSDGERPSFALRYKGSDKTSDSNPVMKFDLLGTSDNIERSYSAGSNGYQKATLKLGGATFTVWNASDAGVDDFDIYVDLNGDGETSPGAALTALDKAFVSINTRYGASITFLNASANGSDFNSLFLNISTPDTDDYESLEPMYYAANLTAASGEVSLAETSPLNLITPEDLDNTAFTYNSLGAFFQKDTPSSDPATVDIEYPNAQRLPQVFVTAGAISTSSTTTAEGDIIYYETTPVEVGSAKLASEVADIRSQNAILVGGPCANTAAAEVMGTSPDNCAEDFTQGKALLKLFEHTNGNVALLVAGYDAIDTRRAARVLGNHEQYQESGDLQGTEVEVTGTSFTDISVMAPEVVVEPEAPVEPDAPVNETV